MNLNEETIIKAYSMGIFPMSENYNDPNIYWINPKKRGIIPINKFKISIGLKFGWSNTSCHCVKFSYFFTIIFFINRRFPISNICN